MIELYEIEELDLIIVKMRGEISFLELMQKASDSIKLDKFKMRTFQITDLRDAKLKITQDEFYEYINFLKSSENFKRAANVIYITNEPKATAYSYLVSQYFMELSLDNVFSTVEGALKYLGLNHVKDILNCYIEMD